MRRERGFTLLEVLIAFIIAALALGVMIKAAGGGLISAHTAGRYEQAVSRARSHLAALGRNAALATGDSEGDDGDGYRWHLTVTPVATSQPVQQPLNQPQATPFPSVTLFAVIVEISWPDAGGERRVTLRSERLGAPTGGTP
jgi:general secretion pathway protein I